MIPHLTRNVPVAVICNISETFYDFLSRAGEESECARLVHGEQYRGDRALLWVGDPKLLIVSLPIPHASDLMRRLGYEGTTYLAPAAPSPWLSLDILREPALLQALVAYAGPERTVQLVPYATTPQFMQLVATLREAHGLTILLPESPAPEALWLRDYIDTKAGFHLLVPHWLAGEATLPRAIVCHSQEEAASVVHWFISQGQPCLVKADDGENGIGNLVIQPDAGASVMEHLNALRYYSFLSEGWLTVEAFIPSSGRLSPSLELFVPPQGSGIPEITYVCNQLFLAFGDFCGVLLSRDLLAARWYAPLAESGLRIARGLQEMGYVGHFDLDAVVDDEGRLFLLEINARRTGGTHAHEAGHFLFGPAYLEQVALLSHDAMSSGALTSSEALLACLEDLLYPLTEERTRGVIITGTSALAVGEFGCLIVAPTTEEVIDLQQQVKRRIAQATAVHPTATEHRSLIAGG
ncbi:MAG: hypothetical protein H0T73_21790 [Ardenticatenales bacterium]|nr:hypothetical protein [Ardenticatenales bacterium]